MDETSEVEVACPHCGHVQHARVWEGANASRFPALVEELLDGRFNAPVCAGCQRRFVIERELLWTQLDRGWYVSVYPRRDRERVAAIVPVVEKAFENAVAVGPVAVQLALREVRRRLVFGYDELREKVLCIEAGLDDAELEMTKIALLQRFPEWCAQPGMTGLVLAALEPEVLVFRLVDAVDAEATVAVPRRYLEAVQEARSEWATECWFPPPYVHVTSCVSLL
jgi:hypothetical protein